jgi:hypothetical protein
MRKPYWWFYLTVVVPGDIKSALSLVWGVFLDYREVRRCSPERVEKILEVYNDWRA